MNSSQFAHLKELLDRLYQDRSAAHLANDPLAFCHRYRDPADQEVVGLIASAFAYGNVKVIRRTLEGILGIMGRSPRRYVERFEPSRGEHDFTGFRHRFHDNRDLCALLLAIRTMLEEADAIGDFFIGCHNVAADDVTTSLNEFCAAVLAFDYRPVFGPGGIPEDSSFPVLFPSPARGSACKRLCMFLRWMVRPADGIDLGLWKGISPAQLVMPVDGHIRRISRYLGLTARNQADWRMAREITATLRRLDPADPVKYDFSLCHLGISAGCDGKDPANCNPCALSAICRGEAGLSGKAESPR